MKRAVEGKKCTQLRRISFRDRTRGDDTHYEFKLRQDGMFFPLNCSKVSTFKNTVFT